MNIKLCKVKNLNMPSVAKQLCNLHYLRKKYHGSTDKPKDFREKLMDEGNSYCEKCKTIKPICQFNKDNSKKSDGISPLRPCGLSLYCKNCSQEINRSKYKRLRNTYKNIELNKKYKMSLDIYNEILKKQNGRCMICNKSSNENKKMLCVDHDHKTNKIRGILCHRCNTELEYLKMMLHSSPMP